VLQLSAFIKAFEKVYNQVFVYIELYLNCDASILQSFLVYGIITDPEIEWPALSLGHLAAISYLIRRRLRLKRLSVRTNRIITASDPRGWVFLDMSLKRKHAARPKRIRWNFLGRVPYKMISYGAELQK